MVNGVDIIADKDVMSKILGSTTKRIKSVRQVKGSEKFLVVYGNLDDMNGQKKTKKTLKVEYQLLFELVNKCLLPRS